MTAKQIIEQVEKLFGRQPEQYMFQLINDALDDIASTKQNYTVSKTSTDEDTLLIHCLRPADNGDGWFEIVFPRDKLEDYVLL